ncbi:MAG: DCC1-like thiol-disulfide oxidoreductase family protein [Pseudomonadota bacterium]
MTREPYSYRNDPAVPSFPDDRPLILFDGDCVLCSGSARFILRHDRTGRFRLAPVQSPLGQALLAHYGVDPTDPSTMLLIQGGEAHQRSEAVLRIAAGLPAPISAVSALRWLPGGCRDAVYLWVARRRRRLTGPTWCAMPDKASTDRILA